MTHICISRLTITGSDNGLSPGRRQAIIWTNAGKLLIGPLGTNYSEFLVEIVTFSCKKMSLNVSSAKWPPFCLGLNVLSKMIVWHRIGDRKPFEPRQAQFDHAYIKHCTNALMQYFELIWLFFFLLRIYVYIYGGTIYFWSYPIKTRAVSDGHISPSAGSMWSTVPHDCIKNWAKIAT